MTDPAVLDELERLEKAATPGIWARGCAGDREAVVAPYQWRLVRRPICFLHWPADSVSQGANASLIVDFRNNAVSLIQDSRKLRELLADVRAVFTGCACIQDMPGERYTCEACRRLMAWVKEAK